VPQQPPHSTEANGASAPNSPNTSRTQGRLRLFLGSSLILAITLFALPGTIQVYQSTLGAPPPSRFRRCDDGIRALFAGYSRLFSPVNPTGERIAPRSPLADPAVRTELVTLDDALNSLQSRCTEEGPAGLQAFQAFRQWRFRSEDAARLLEHTVTPDAERALRYESPQQTASSSPTNSHSTN
jgi:hypothetical protein